MSVRQAVAMTSAASSPSLRRALPPVYAAAALRLIGPLLLLPLMASRTGAAEFGRLGFILVWAALLSTLVEGGFLAAATRLAVVADDAGRAAIARQVFTARVVLSLPVPLLAILAAAWAGSPQTRWADTLWIAALAVAMGWPAAWYLQASQQLAAWSRVEVALQATFIAAVWAVADSVGHYLALQLLLSGALAVLGWWWLRRDLSRTSGHAQALWARDELLPGLRLGWTMLPVSLAGAAYSFALPAAASSRMSKADLGTYYMADRIVRSLLAGAEPVFALVYPRIVGLFAGEGGERRALRYALRWSVGGLVVGAALYVLLLAAWPWAQTWLARDGHGFAPGAVQAVATVLGLLLPLLLGWKFIGYWMLGSGRYDRAYRACVVVGGIAGVASALTVGGQAGALGLAWTALAVELTVIAVALAGVGLTARLRQRG
ncbi:oligosaccharide flippase family protein [Ideonella sp. YS5]|uniref:oligosaccharide flippase family protein n=1 Tax=Ideonella sp. YS5 TaxID=3453714 RepID=UPI003EEAD89A